MSGFSFTALAECEMCGNPLSDSDEECDVCDESEDVLMVFRRLQSHETKTLPLSMMADTDYMWEKFARSLDGEDPLGWVWLGDSEFVESMLDGLTEDITEISHRQMTIGYSGEEDLRELASYE